MHAFTVTIKTQYNLHEGKKLYGIKMLLRITDGNFIIIQILKFQ